MRPIHSIVTIAGTLVLVGCENPQSKQSAQSIFQAFGATDLVSQASAPAAVAYVEVEPEPPAPPPPCDNYMWRWNWYDCRGNLLGPVE